MAKMDSRGPGTRKRSSRGRFVPKRKVCLFCTDRTQTIDYKKISMLREFITDRGKIQARRRTGLCPKHQRKISAAIKRARYIALLPYTAEHIRQSGGIAS